MATYSIYNADVNAERGEILALALRNLPGMTEGRFRKYFDLNPIAPPRVILARDAASGAAVGMASLLPIDVVLGGRRVRGAIIGDFAVEEGHRGFGPARAIQRAAVAASASGETAFILGMPNRAAERVIRRTGYADLGSFTRFVRPLRSRTLIHDATGRQLAARMLAPVADAAVGLFDLSRRPARGTAVQHPRVFDDRFEGVWRAAHARHDVIPQRSADYLNWKYETDSDHSRYAILALTRDDEVLAYAVYRTTRGIRHVLDLVWRDGTDHLGAILVALLRDARAAHDEAITILRLGYGDELGRRLRRLAFIRRAESESAFVYVADPTLRALIEPARWYLLAGDADI